jgi:tetratricopeptide (TPR) repeat protein
VLLSGFDCRKQTKTRRHKARAKVYNANYRCLRMNEQGITYARVGMTDSALACFHEALKLAEDSSLPERASASLQDIARVWEFRGEHDSARKYYDLAGQYMDTTSKAAKADAAGTLMNKAAFLLSLPDKLDSARALLLEALALARQADDRRQAASIAFNLGTLYARQGKHDSAMALYSFSLEAGGPNPDNRAPALSSIARLLFMHGKFDSAFKVMSSALDLLPRTHDRATEADVLCDGGVLLGHMGQYAAARGCFERARDIYEQLDRRVQAAIADENIAILFNLECLSGSAEDEEERRRTLDKLRWHDA